MRNKNGIEYHNLSGAADPTAFAAMSSVQREQDEGYVRMSRVIAAVKTLLDLSGYDLLNRIELRDRFTGKIYR